MMYPSPKKDYLWSNASDATGLISSLHKNQIYITMPWLTTSVTMNLNVPNVMALTKNLGSSVTNATGRVRIEEEGEGVRSK